MKDGVIIMKKIPDFGTLNLSKIVATSATEKTEEVSVTQTDKPTVETKSPKTQEGTWVNGIPVKDLTPEEFKEWLITIIPGTGVENWENKLVATEKDRSGVITQLAIRYENLFHFPKKQVEVKQYLQ